MRDLKLPDQLYVALLQSLAAAGRRGDDSIAHLDAGELVIPRSLVAKYAPTLAALFEAEGIDPNRFFVGHKSNSINPITGLREFGEDSANDSSDSSDGFGGNNNDGWGNEESAFGDPLGGSTSATAPDASTSASTHDGNDMSTSAATSVEHVSFNEALARAEADYAAGTPGFGTGPAGSGTSHQEAGNLGAYGAGLNQGGVGYNVDAGVVGRALGRAQDTMARALSGNLTANEKMGMLTGLASLAVPGLGLLTYVVDNLNKIVPNEHKGSAPVSMQGDSLNDALIGGNDQSDIAKTNASETSTGAATVIVNDKQHKEDDLSSLLSGNSYRIQAGAPEWTTNVSQELEKAVAAILNKQPSLRRPFSRQHLLPTL